MNDQSDIIVIIAIVVIIIFLVVKGIKSIKNSFSGKSYSDQEVHQAITNVKASEMADGPGDGIKNKKGFRRIFWLLIAAILAYLLFFSQLSNELFK
ncbi:MAG: hypothetical protein L3J08_09440 [Flavobacteriaceae bacterium]|nr:hypothetical protein [Flavobacteriaceae bacterium]